MSIVGSLLSRGMLSKKATCSQRLAACRLIRFPDLMAILQIWTPHLPMSLQYAKLSHEFADFSPTGVSAKSNRQEQTQDIDRPRLGLIWMDDHCASALEQATKAPQLVQTTELPS